LNKGNRGNIHSGAAPLQFEDITEKAGVGGKRAWSTGVSLADVNGDGWLDIYVCNSGDVEGDNKQNELFINKQDGTFTEAAEAYGLADKGYSTHAAFFDYDKDGDLDCYLLNNSYQAIGSFNLRKNERPNRDPVGGDKLYRNDGDYFTDVSEEAGIYGSVIGFGLGVTVGDMNLDGWPDIYVSNDFFERDYLYLNNQDGTFTEILEEGIRSISGASMGADMADINNDGYSDIFVTEMLPEDEGRLKTKTTFENWDRYQYNLKNDYYHQFTRNMLHMNISPPYPSPGGDKGGGGVSFSEIGRLAGVEATDWSWGALIMDMDNDGLKDIFVANGIYQDLTDQDYIQYISNQEVAKSIITDDNVDFKKLIDAIPSEQIPNYAFANQGNLQFVNRAAEWGLSTPSHSNGSAYGDLDNDGDLDLVVNNVNMPAFIYRNETNQLLPHHNYLKIHLVGEGHNTFAVGSKLTIKHQDKMFYLEQMPVRGFESSVDPRPNFGLGDIEKVDSLIVQWPDDRVTLMTDVTVNQMLTLNQKDAESPPLAPPSGGIKGGEEVFTDITQEIGIGYEHVENDFVDFDRERLTFHMLSREGPCLCKGDVNGDGREDFYVGGAKDSPGALYVQTSSGKFRVSNTEIWKTDQLSEDTACAFFDADNDGDADLYVGSGGNEFPTSSSALIDRLYLNQGNGNYIKSTQILPTFRFESTGSVSTADYDEDGDMDLFVGIRLRPFLYGVPVNGYLLENDGTGKFKDITKEKAPGLLNAGMITDGIWADIDNDNDQDLIVSGEYMPIKIFINEQGKLEDNTQAWGMDSTQGWWNKITVHDIDGDGDQDIIAGNHGWNSRFRAGKDKPVRMYVNDFDKNGTTEQIVTQYNDTAAYPLVLRHDLVMQLPSLKKKYLKYASYKGQQVTDIFTAEQLEGSVVLEARELGSSVFINEGDKFVKKNLPVEAQVSPVYGIAVGDYDGDGQEDVLMGGNFYGAKPEVGRYDASYGTLLKGDGQGNYKAVPNRKTGLYLEGEVRVILPIEVGGKSLLILAKNNGALQVIETRPNKTIKLF